MSPAAQVVIMLSAIVFSFAWVSIPSLEYFSLQLVALVIIVYAIIKRASNSAWYAFAPRALSAEIALLTVSVLVCISATGNMESLYWPISYIHLFFLVIALRPPAAILSSLALVLFHYALTPSISPDHISTLASIPLLLLVFLFTKKQYEAHKIDAAIIEDQQQQLSAEEQSATTFIKQFLQPKLQYLFQLTYHPKENATNIQEQIRSIYLESERIFTQVHHDDTPPTQD